MAVKSLISFGAVVLALGASPAMAQTVSADEAAQLRSQIEALRAQVNALEARLNASQAAPAQPAPTPVIAVTTPVPATTAPAATAIAANSTTTEWRGAPEFRSAGGWSFKPRGRLQLDVGGVDAPAAINDTGFGYGAEIRRLQVGVDGTTPGGFTYRLEAELSDNAIALTDAYIAYGKGPLSITAGNHKPANGLEELTSDLFTSFTERAAFTQAFGFERRLGLSGTWAKGPLIVQAGVFSDDVTALTNASNNSWSIDGRVVFGPKIGATQLHFGASAHTRDFNDALPTTRYRARPFIHTTDTRLVDTSTYAATGESLIAAEFAAVHGRFHASAEGAWLTSRRAILPNARFSGGYAEIGAFLTNDSRNWRKGVFDRVSPRRALGAGGMGALELNLRYDWLDLSDAGAGIIGGQQDIYGASLTWIATPYVRFIANYGHIELSDARVAAGADRDYSADALALRAQLDF